jgi:hypothetical protein
MNTILTKCIVELKNEQPRIDYVLGMLETLAEMQGGTQAIGVDKPTYHTNDDMRPADIYPRLNSYENGPIGNITP